MVSGEVPRSSSSRFLDLCFFFFFFFFSPNTKSHDFATFLDRNHVNTAKNNLKMAVKGPKPAETVKNTLELPITSLNVSRRGWVKTGLLKKESTTSLSEFLLLVVCA